MALLGPTETSAIWPLSGAQRTLSKNWQASVRLKETDHVPDRDADRAVIVLGPHRRKAKHSTDPGTQGGRTVSGGTWSLRESGLAASAAAVRSVALRPHFVHDVVLARVLDHL
jgi:hypothetical protein